MKRVNMALLVVIFTCWQAAAADVDWWWPVQKEPEKLVVVPMREIREMAGEADEAGAWHMLAQSLAGLAARAVNEGEYDEMLWIDPHSAASDEWLKRVKKRMKLEPRENPGLWELVRGYHEAGVVRGYVVYRWEDEPRAVRAEGVGDDSANLATMLAGVHRGILVTETMEKEAVDLGLRKLADARDADAGELFEEIKDRLDARWVLVQSPCMPFARDIAITHRMAVVYGTGKNTEAVYKWMPAGGLAIGWNSGAEDEAVTQASKYGHTLIPADWATNLTVLSAGAAERGEVARFSSERAEASQAEKPRMGMLMSDGDNLQWMLTGFTHDAAYWANPARGKIPIGWGLPVSDLFQAAPDVHDHLVETQSKEDSILAHIGYYYPDRFGVALGAEGREKALRILGNRIESALKRSGTSLLTLLVHDSGSAAAKDAYEVIAECSPTLEAIYVVRYHPYEGDAGKVLRIKRTDGREVLVSSARYALWAETSGRDRAGDPERLREVISADVSKGAAVDGSWIVLHAWSRFRDGEGRMQRGVGPAHDLFQALGGDVDFTGFGGLAR